MSNPGGDREDEAYSAEVQTYSKPYKAQVYTIEPRRAFRDIACDAQFVLAVHMPGRSGCVHKAFFAKPNQRHNKDMAASFNSCTCSEDGGDRYGDPC